MACCTKTSTGTESANLHISIVVRSTSVPIYQSNPWYLRMRPCHAWSSSAVCNLQKFAIVCFWQKFRESNVFTKEELISRNIFRCELWMNFSVFLITLFSLLILLLGSNFIETLIFGLWRDEYKGHTYLTYHKSFGRGFQHLERQLALESLFTIVL